MGDIRSTYDSLSNKRGLGVKGHRQVDGFDVEE